MEKGTILIVDDNKGVLASLELLLETEFSEIKTAGNAHCLRGRGIGRQSTEK